MLFFALCDRYSVVKIQSGTDCHDAFPNKLVAPERERAIRVKGAIRVTAPDRKGPKPKGQELAQS
ncbi:hypothetical protein B6R26_22080 [Escherichia coli]|nr:hypothetical protein [Escherichia coli]EEW2231756.1 hypothetical protein [Escherichia coli]EFA4592221.1 hypothetical protein [Escherichia coli]EFA4875231.1 hypothetical protein [Escherichia coli]EFB5170306.1 hypothetical protein [Escherichia coli]